MLQMATGVRSGLCRSENRNAQEVIEANCHVRLTHSKTALKYFEKKFNNNSFVLNNSHVVGGFFLGSLVKYLLVNSLTKTFKPAI